ncbi:molybdate ABC transporter substrate-binding protein [bacterium]|nr:molybdate ABC transporter substrate-binding protein [bacterium]
MNRKTFALVFVIGLTFAMYALISSVSHDRISRLPTADLRDSARVVVYAPASLVDVLRAAKDSADLHRGFTVVQRFASTSTLAREIVAGRGCDLFITDHPRWSDMLLDRKLLKQDSIVPLAETRLALVAPEGKGFILEWRRGFPIGTMVDGPIALAHPEHVPAGLHARDLLQQLDWWKTVRRRLYPLANERAVLHQVELGQAGAGFVYEVDLFSARKTELVGIAPDSIASRIEYYAFFTVNAREEAFAYLDELQSASMQSLWTHYGFLPIMGGPDGDTDIGPDK